MQRSLRKNRNNIDWSAHVLTIHKVENPCVHITDFGIPGSNYGRVCFLNACGILSVTGDYGNWIFCREFWPSERGYVSDSYWAEKLRNSSVQESSDFCAVSTADSIKELIRELRGLNPDTELVAEGDENEDAEATDEPITDPDVLAAIEFWNECLEQIECSDERGEPYITYAHENLTCRIDSDSIPYEKKHKQQLTLIFDAFDAICQRLADAQDIVPTTVVS